MSEHLDTIKQDVFAILDHLWRVDRRHDPVVDPKDVLDLLRLNNRFHQPVEAWLTEWEARHISEWKDAPGQRRESEAGRE